MSDYYQQDQSGWEWRDQEDERWHAENINDGQVEKLTAAKPMIDHLLVQFDSVFGLSEESN